MPRLGRDDRYGLGIVGCSRDGFSLIEALVAMAMLAAAGVVALQVVSSSSDRSARATARLRATLAAEALLNRVGLDLPLKAQSLAGAFQDGSSWRLSVRAYEEDGSPRSPDDRLLRVEVEVAPKGRRRDAVRLVTLRLVNGPL